LEIEEFLEDFVYLGSMGKGRLEKSRS
jgi:hypothetical protein